MKGKIYIFANQNLPHKYALKLQKTLKNTFPTFAISEYGVSKNNCNGCGRCISSCPLNCITEYKYYLSQESLKDLLLKIKPDAVEILQKLIAKMYFRKSQKLLKIPALNLKKSVSCGLA